MLISRAYKIGVDQDRVRYIDPKSKKTYSRETSSIMADAMKLWGPDIPRNKCIFFRDGGNAFKNEKQSVFDDVDARNHFIMPSEAHAHISTCDSGVNSRAKNAWRNMAKKGVFDIAKEPESTLYLLKCFDDISSDDIKKYWNRNFDLDNNESSFEDVKNLTKNAAYKWDDFHSECLELYEDYINNQLLEVLASTRENRIDDTGLNGRYHTTPVSKKRARTTQE